MNALAVRAIAVTMTVSGVPAVAARAQSASPAPAPIVVLRAAVGPSGQVRNGDYVLDEERASFDPAKDKQVVVYFQWQGSPGVHRMSVTWKSPDGASSSTSPIEYRAQDRRFGGYWPLTLSETSAVGTWTVDATVDGQAVGRLTFNVGANAVAVPAAPTRRVLTQSELFTRLSESLVVLERSSAKGRRLDAAAAVAIGHGRLLTSVAAVDGADAIVAVLPDGKRQRVTTIFGLNRAQDWIVLAGGSETDQTLPIIGESAVQIGDRCFSIEASAGGSRLLTDAAVSGRARTPLAGTRIVFNQMALSGTPGSPVLTEFGELIGVVGGALVPGVSDLADLLQFRGALRGVPIVSAGTATVAPDAAPVAFTDAWGRGDILHALEGREHVVSGGFAKGIMREDTVRPSDQRETFSAGSDKEFVIFITWGPQTRLRGLSTLRLYDEGNQIIVDSKPVKLDVRAGYPSTLSSWKMNVPARPGVYRAEVLLDGTPIWRGFVRVTE